MTEHAAELRRAATEIVSKMRQAGYIAYFAGGWVRDFLLGHPADDIDIATEAPPERVRELFSKTVPVGISFGVVIVLVNDHPFEVTSFRKDGLYLYGRRPETIEFATPQEDAQRRDFTINGMFYDPLEDRVIDFVGGQEDLRRGVVRAIGEAEERIKEDRLRMIRAVRMIARFQFSLEESTRQAIEKYAASLFPAVAVERVWQELQKMADYPGLDRALIELHALGLLPVIFPLLEGTPLERIRKRVKPFAAFPPNCPLILYLAQLFPRATPEQFNHLCTTLKVPGRDAKLLINYLHASQQYRSNWAEKSDWVHLYASLDEKLCRAVYATHLRPAERQAFLTEHDTRSIQLFPHIERARLRQPLVRAEHLQAEGILPGKQMGILLKHAEKLAIELDLHKAEPIIQQLKRSSLWPTPS